MEKEKGFNEQRINIRKSKWHEWLLYLKLQSGKRHIISSCLLQLPTQFVCCFIFNHPALLNTVICSFCSNSSLPSYWFISCQIAFSHLNNDRLTCHSCPPCAADTEGHLRWLWLGHHPTWAWGSGGWRRCTPSGGAVGAGALSSA